MIYCWSRVIYIFFLSYFPIFVPWWFCVSNYLGSHWQVLYPCHLIRLLQYPGGAMTWANFPIYPWKLNTFFLFFFFFCLFVCLTYFPWCCEIFNAFAWCCLIVAILWWVGGYNGVWSKGWCIYIQLCWKISVMQINSCMGNVSLLT